VNRVTAMTGCKGRTSGCDAENRQIHLYDGACWDYVRDTLGGQPECTTWYLRAEDMDSTRLLTKRRRWRGCGRNVFPSATRD
jgi:hypothetical protein